VIGPNTAPNPSSTTYPVTGLRPRTTYYFRVRAYNSGGDSAYSSEASATTPR
jgi:titin